MKNTENSEIFNQSWPKEDLEYLGVCPLCDSYQRTLLYKELQDYAFFCAPGLWSFYLCDVCQCAYLDPRPTSDSIGRAYQNYFTHALEVQAVPDSLRHRLSQIGQNGYLNRKWGTSLAPASNIVSKLLRPSIRASIDGQLMRNLPRSADGRKLLDVGCGSGQFLAMAQNAGWVVTGFDFDPKAVEAAIDRGLDVYVGGFDTLQPDLHDHFDAITVSHVIEHVYNPKELLADCYRLLKPGGYFWIETPNVESLGHTQFLADWRGLEPPRHIVLYTWAKLENMLAEQSFARICPTGWRPEYMNIYFASKAINKRTKTFEMNRSVLHKIQEIFVEIGNWTNHKKREFITLQATK